MRDIDPRGPLVRIARRFHAEVRLSLSWAHVSAMDTTNGTVLPQPVFYLVRPGNSVLPDQHITPAFETPDELLDFCRHAEPELCGTATADPTIASRISAHLV